MACLGCEERRKMMIEAFNRMTKQAANLVPSVPEMLRRSFDSKAFMADLRKNQRSAPVISKDKPNG